MVLDTKNCDYVLKDEEFAVLQFGPEYLALNNFLSVAVETETPDLASIYGA